MAYPLPLGGRGWRRSRRVRAVCSGKVVVFKKTVAAQSLPPGPSPQTKGKERRFPKKPFNALVIQIPTLLAPQFRHPPLKRGCRYVSQPETSKGTFLARHTRTGVLGKSFSTRRQGNSPHGSVNSLPFQQSPTRPLLGPTLLMERGRPTEARIPGTGRDELFHNQPRNQ